MLLRIEGQVQQLVVDGLCDRHTNLPQLPPHRTDIPDNTLVLLQESRTMGETHCVSIGKVSTPDIYVGKYSVYRVCQIIHLYKSPSPCQTSVLNAAIYIQ